MSDSDKNEVVKPTPSYTQVTERIILSSAGVFLVMVGVATIINAVKRKE